MQISSITILTKVVFSEDSFPHSRVPSLTMALTVAGLGVLTADVFFRRLLFPVALLSGESIRICGVIL